MLKEIMNSVLKVSRGRGDAAVAGTGNLFAATLKETLTPSMSPPDWLSSFRSECLSIIGSSQDSKHTEYIKSFNRHTHPNRIECALHHS